MTEIFSTLDEWLLHLGWSRNDLADQAGIDAHTAGNAVRGEAISPRTARKIAAAITRASGKTVHPGDIRGLVISRGSPYYPGRNIR